MASREETARQEKIGAELPLDTPLDNDGINMTNERALAILREIFSGNHFTNYVGIVIDEVEYGKAVLHLDIDAAIHANLSGHVHGGALYTLANTAAGVAAMSTGRFIVTEGMTINFIRNIVPGDTATCYCRTNHIGRHIISLIAEIYDGKERLMAECIISMFVTGYSRQIPGKW